MPDAANELNDTMLEWITDILLVVADLEAGVRTSRLRTVHGPDHVLSNLYEGINQMVDSLARERDRTEMYQRELEEKLAMIEVQRAAIQELATPIIEIWERVLCLPVVGVLDTTRSAQMTEALLSAIVEKKAVYAIIDITGIQVMDTGTVDHFLRMARAVRLLGAKCMLTGVNPAIAQTITHMGLDLKDVLIYRTMRNALQRHVMQFLERREDTRGAR